MPPVPLGTPPPSDGLRVAHKGVQDPLTAGPGRFLDPPARSGPPVFGEVQRGRRGQYQTAQGRLRCKAGPQTIECPQSYRLTK